MKLKKNDEVKVLSGREVGKVGRILRIDKQKSRVIVEGVNMVKKSVKKRSQNEQGGIIEVEASIHISNVQLFSKNKKSRIGFQFDAQGKKQRIAKKTGEILS